MTDNEIIKALECCTKGEDCTHCPLIEELPYCGDDIMVDALNLIKRQQAEIEQLKFEIAKLSQVEVSYKLEARIKSEAVKEFAVRLKCGVPQETGVIRCSDVDNLVKEIVGEQ